MIIISSNSHMKTLKFREFKYHAVYPDHLHPSITEFIPLFWSYFCTRDIFSLSWKAPLYVSCLRNSPPINLTLGKTLRHTFSFSQELSGELSQIGNIVTPNCGLWASSVLRFLATQPLPGDSDFLFSRCIEAHLTNI